MGRTLFDTYDILLFATGVALLLTTVGWSLLARFNISKTLVYLVVGLGAGPLFLEFGPKDPLAATPTLERVSELAVIMSLIVLGIRIGRPLSWIAWRSTVRLILIVMPATVGLIAVAGWTFLGLALGPALLLGAVLAPTDPILAGALEEHTLDDESEDRFGLSSESGLNDGFAFPFVYLGINFSLDPHGWTRWIGPWLARDLVYAVLLALPFGWYLGKLCGHWFIAQERQDGINEKRRVFTPLALLLAAYGLAELLGAYGFLAAFTTGLGFRRSLDRHRETLTLFARFTDSVDDLAKAVVLILLGALLRVSLFEGRLWPLLAFALVVILVIRPGLVALATVGGGFRGRERFYWAWFGIRGIGSLYYLSYAINRGVLSDGSARVLFAIVSTTILASALLHGSTLRPFMRRVEGIRKVEE